MKKITCVVILYVILNTLYFMLPQVVRAEYVLPYPSYMPGNKLYKIARMLDIVKTYWHWGTIGQIKYHMGLSDKYLVEAKTLFEYKQYLLATNALERSDIQVVPIPNLIKQGVYEGKDMSIQKQNLSDAMQVHITTLEFMKTQLPKEFQWTPEKETPTNLSIGSLLDASVTIRQAVRSQLQGGM